MAGEDDTFTDDQIDGSETGSDPGEINQTDTSVDAGGKTPAKQLSVRESIAAALKEHASKDDTTDETGKKPDIKPPAKGAAAPGQKAGDKASKTTPPQGGAPQGTAQGSPQEIPAVWKARSELSTLWSGLTPAAQAAISKRETEMSNGVDKLKNQFQELDQAVKPYDESIRRFGFTRAQAVDQLFKWQMALAGPNKIEAFRHLMRSHGVDPATVAGAPQGAPNGAQPNGTAAIPAELNTVLQGIVNKIGQLDQDRVAQTQNAAQQTVMTWSQGKPHFEKVRQLMGQLIQSGAVPNLPSGHPDLDAAYDRAIYTDPEVRALVLAEEQAKKTATNKAAIEAKRRAGQSMRVGSPAAPAANNGPTRKKGEPESARDSITRALAELRQ